MENACFYKEVKLSPVEDTRFKKYLVKTIPHQFDPSDPNYPLMDTVLILCFQSLLLV